METQTETVVVVELFTILTPNQKVLHPVPIGIMCPEEESVGQRIIRGLEELISDLGNNRPIPTTTVRVPMTTANTLIRSICCSVCHREWDKVPVDEVEAAVTDATQYGWIRNTDGTLRCPQCHEERQLGSNGGDQ